MRAFSLISVALLVTMGHAFEALAWTRDLEAHNPFAGLESRASKGKSGGGGGGSGDDDCSGSGACPSQQKLCGDFCIPTNATCCGEGDDVGGYCQSSERCVRSEEDDDEYVCCPSGDSSCGGDDSDAEPAQEGNRPKECGASGMLVSGMWALGAAGAVVAFGL